MTAKLFLFLAGIALIGLGILGMIGLLGPTPIDSYFGQTWWFDFFENWSYLIGGIVAVVGAVILPVAGQKTLAVFFGVIGVAVGLYSMFNPSLFGANFEKPADTILATVVGLWGLIAARKPA
jgi:hypothetical protein